MTITLDIVRQAITSMVHDHAKTSLRNILKRLNLPTSDITDEHLARARTSSTIDKDATTSSGKLKKDHVPRGLNPAIDNILNIDEGTTGRKLNNDKPLRQSILRWISDMDIEAIFRAEVNGFTLDMLELDITQEDDAYRTVSTPFRSILKDTNDAAGIVPRLDAIAEKCTDLYHDMCKVIHLNMISYAAMNDHGSTMINIQQLRLNIDHQQSLLHQGFTSSDPQSSEDSKLLFSFQHIQYLYTNHFGMGSQAPTHSKYPLWKKIMGDGAQSFYGLSSQTANEVISTISTNVQNMYTGARITRSLLRSVIDVLLKRQLGDFSGHFDDKYPVFHASEDDCAVHRPMENECPAYRAIDDEYPIYQPMEEPCLLYQLHDDEDFPGTCINQDEEMTCHEVDTTANTLADLQLGAKDIDKSQTKLLSRRSKRNALHSKIKTTKKQLQKLEKLEKTESLTIAQIKKKEKTNERLKRLEDEMKQYNEEAKEATRTLPITKTQINTKEKKEGKRRDSQKKRRDQIRGLLMKICLQEEDVSANGINSFWEQPEDLSSKEIDIIVHIYNNIRPFLRHVYPSKCSIASQVPFCVLANAILKSANVTSEMRALVPHTSSGDIHALTITAKSLYENVNDLIPDFERRGINSARTATSRPNDTFSLVFSVDKINEKCEGHNLDWIRRIIMTSNGMARIIGKVRDRSRLVPQYQPAKFAPTIIQGSQSFLKSHIEELKIERQQLQESSDTTKSDLLSKKDDLQRIRHEPDNDHQVVRDLKQECRDLQSKLCDNDESLRVNEKTIAITKRSLNTKSNKDQKKDREKIVLSSDNPICLAPAHFMDITQLQSDEHQLGFTGVDYGFRTLATSVPMKEEQAKYHLDMLTSDHPPERFIRLPKAITLKSETIFDSTGERERRRKLEYKKQNTIQGKGVTEAERALSVCSMRKAVTPSQINDADKAITSQRSTVRAWYNGTYMKRASRQREYQTRKWKDRILARERKTICKRLKDQKPLTPPLKHRPIFMIGHAGMGYGSRIKGFLRYGGKWMRETHARYWPVAVVNEYRTSQVCAFCGHQVIRPASANQKRSRGASLCVNPRCVSYKNRHATSGRDQMAAANILIKGYARTQNVKIAPLEYDL